MFLKRPGGGCVGVHVVPSRTFPGVIHGAWAQQHLFFASILASAGPAQLYLPLKEPSHALRPLALTLP